MNVRAFFFDYRASQASALHLDPDRADRHALALQVGLQGRYKLPQFGSDCVGADQQAPLPIFNGASLHAGTQWGWQEAFDGLHPL